VGDKGVTSTLTVKDARILHKAGTSEYVGLNGGLNYNPEDVNFGSVYVLTTKEGIVYEIDAATGDLLNVTDTNDNKLTYTLDAVTSSTGQKVTFERDAEGRITSVKDPLGELIKYKYDASGDLISVTDRENNTTRMEYDQEREHYLDKIIDPLDRTGVRNEYGEDGRLKELVDVNGQKLEMTYDPNNSRQTVLDQLAHATTYEYDARGNILTEIDALGQITKRKYDDNNYVLSETVISDRSGQAGFTTTYSYDDQGNKLTEEDSLGNVTRYTYGDKSRLLTETDPLGRTTTNTYSRSGNLRSTTDATGKTTTYSYDIKGQLQSIASPNNVVTQVEYDTFGNVAKLSNSEGHQSIYIYDNNGNSLSETLRVMTTTGLKESVTTWTYNKQGQIKSVTDPQQRTTHYEYNQLGKQLAVIDSSNRRTEFRYNEKGELVETIYPDDTPNDPLDNPITRSEYDAAGREIARIDQNGRITRSEYDAAGRLTATIYPDETPNDLLDNPRIRTEYYNTSEVKAETDLDGNRIEYEYDALGRQTSIRDSRGYSAAYTFDAVGNKLTETDKQGRTTRFVYDTLGRLSGTYAPDGTYTTFNEAENRLTQTDALGRTTQLNYDTSGRLLNTRFVDGTSVTNTYDSSGRLISTTDQDGETTKFEYDLQGRLKAVADAKRQRTEYNYNSVGNLVSVKDALNEVVTYEYDERGRRQTVILPGERRSSITYDTLGNLERITDFNGKTISYTYNSYNRITSKLLPNQTPTNYTYNLDGLLETTTDSRGTTTYKYDERGRLISRTDPYGPYIATNKPTIEYSYDELGRISCVKTAIGNTIYTYDEDNRLKTVTAPQGETTTYHYDKLGNLIRTELANNVVETRQYNSLNRLIEVKTTRINPVSQQEEIISKFNYTLDAEGNRQSVVERDGRQIKYKYDELDRLTEEINGDRTITYTYDAVGNRLSKTDSQEGVTTYIYNSLNELTSSTINAVTTTYTYDNNGNLISEVTGTNSKTYKWVNDGENRLMGITINNASGTSSIEYRYDAQGIRVAQIVDGVETRFLVDTLQQEPQVLAEYDVAGNIKSSYVYGKDLISQSQGSEQFFYHTDGLGSTKVLTNASGQESIRYLYDAFGNLLSQIGNSDNAYLFAGEQRDSETGLDYLRARYYNSVTGRFISADAYEGTLTDPMSLHDYLYAHANPVMNTDPSGYFTLQEFGAAFAISSIVSGLGIVNGAALLNVLTGGSAYDSLAKYDQFLAGFADIVTFSGSTKLREKLYGSAATSNHRGLFFNLGRFSGGLSGFGLGLAAPTALGGTTWGQKVLVGYDLFGAGFGSYLSTRKFLEGKGTAWDLLAYLPLITYGSRLGYRQVTDGLDWLAARGVVAADLGINRELENILESGSLNQDAFMAIRQSFKEGWTAQLSRHWIDLRGYMILYRGQTRYLDEITGQPRPILSPIAREESLEASYELVRRMQSEGLTNEDIASFTAFFHNEPIDQGPVRFYFSEETYAKIPQNFYGEPLGAAGIPTSKIPGIAYSFAGENGVTLVLRIPKEVPIRPDNPRPSLVFEEEYVVLHQIPNSNVVKVIRSEDIRRHIRPIRDDQGRIIIDFQP
jgi:RHS repeat-associated protein